MSMKQFSFSLFGTMLLVFTGCAQESAPPPPGTTAVQSLPLPPPLHPVLHTPVTGNPINRPAVLVDVLDDSESWFSSAELYLSVQSSQFPASTRVLLPINIGDFEGCRTRFVQLPFEVAPEDHLVFELLDDDVLSAEDEQRIVTGCRLTGYCLLIGGSVYAPSAAKVAAPLMEPAADFLGEAILGSLSMSAFECIGKARFTVTGPLPEQPHKANPLTLLDDSRYCRVQLQIFYGPPAPPDLPAPAAVPGIQ